jgi:hypothetical protein
MKYFYTLMDDEKRFWIGMDCLANINPLFRKAKAIAGPHTLIK